MTRLRYNNKLFKILNNCAFKESNNEVTFNDIKIDFTGCCFEDIPYKYQKAEIIKDNKTVFTGYVDTVKPYFVNKKKKGYIELNLTLLSPLKMATIRTISLIGTYSKEEAIRRILQPLIDDGFTIEVIQVEDGEIITNFVLETIENAMNKVCSKTNTFWHIDANRRIYVYSVDYMFGKSVVKTISENEDLKREGLINIDLSIENVDYANVINFKNVRLIYEQQNISSALSTKDNETQGNPIVSINKVINKGDIIQFDNPVIFDENTLRSIIREEENSENNSETIYYSLMLWIEVNNSNKVFSIEINKNMQNSKFDKYVISDNISFSDNGKEEKEIVLQKDSFFSNIITGFKWNGEDKAIIRLARSNTALRYTTMKFMYTQEIESLKGVISDSGQIERTIDYNEQWTTLKNLIDYGRSLITQNSNVINSVNLEFDINPGLKIGDIVNIEMPSFFVQGKFAVKEIDYSYENKLKQKWKITFKSSDLISTYIDIFRPKEQQETQDKIDTIILSEFVEEKIKEIHTVQINKDNHTLNFNL